MATENIVNVIAALGNADNLTIFEMLMNGKTCGCKIGERFGLDNAGVKAKIAPMVAAGLVDVVSDLEWDKYSINETQVCLLEKYLSEQIAQCRSTGCKCKCNCC